MRVEVINGGQDARGLGYILNNARKYGRREGVVVIILAILIVALLIDQCLYIVQCTLFRWKYGQEADRSLALRSFRRVLSLFWRTETSGASTSR